MILKCKKKPMVLECCQWTGDNVSEMLSFTDYYAQIYFKNETEKGCIVSTPEGLEEARTGDYIIKEASGKFYPCRKESFEEIYEVVQ